MFLLVLALFIIPILFGCSVLAALQLTREKITLLCIGAVGGLACFTTIAYLTTFFVPLSVVSLSLLLVILAAITAGLWCTPHTWLHLRHLPLDYTALGVLVVIILLTLILVPHLLFVDGQQGLSTTVINAWGDLAWHMANITTFAAGQSIPPQSPIFAGHRLNYPFMVNVYSATLLVGGASIAQTVVLPALVLIPLLFTLLYCLTRYLTASRWAGIVAVVLFFGGGATFGWVRLWQDWQGNSIGMSFLAFIFNYHPVGYNVLQQAPKPLLDFLLHLPRDYTGAGADADGYHFLNSLLALFLPQRSFLFGMPLALSIPYLLLTSRKDQAGGYMVAGVLAGMVPLFHGHTVLVLLPLITALFILSPGLPWLLFVLTAAIVGLPEVFYYLLGSSESGSFFRWAPGWSAGDHNLFLFWLKNTGFLLPATLIGFCLPAPKLTKVFAGVGWLVLLVANLYAFAPWPWDNFKLIIYWLVLCLPLLGWLATYIGSRSRVWAALVVLVVGLHVFTGSLDLVKTVLPTATQFGEWDAEAITIAAKIKAVTPVGSTIVTAPYHNSPVALSGRLMYLGFTGHVWSHGGLPWARESGLKPFFAGQTDVLPEYQPQYVLVGGVERTQFPGLTIRPTWRLVAQTPNYQLYALPTTP